MFVPSNLNRFPSNPPPTPLVPIRLSPESPLIYCKLDFLNPSGSTKDRIARYILEKALRDGRVKPGGTVIEASSGSTSIAMALTCAQLGLRFIAVMPEGVSNERVLMIRAYGGGIHFTPRAEGVREAIRRSERLASNTDAFLPCQFANPENASAHEFGTAREILNQLSNGRVDAVVSGVGTGGTLVGLYRGFAGSGHPVRPVLARPVNLTRSREEECCSFSCRIPGVVDSISTIFHAADFPNLITVEVDDREAIQVTRQLIGMGFPVGPSSGLNYRAAMIASQQLDRQLHPDATIVTVFPDRMERYFTTDLFQPFLLEI
ncbi:MAG: cysteine synthase family protein [Acidobacteriota bacterium]|nr:cysteine synthase family protein [Acidobacteriota bacterium]